MAAINKTALVTGSTSGIGLSIAHALAKQKVNIILSGTRDESDVNSVVQDITRYGVTANYVQADLSKVSEIETLFLKVSKLCPDGIDILINNAGLMTYSPIEKLADAQWELQIAVSLSAPFHLIKRFLPTMKNKGWGRLVNISSITGLVAWPNMTAYSAAKHGLIGLTKGVALETAAFGITCNAVCPGGVRSTKMFKSTCEDLAADFGMSVEDVEKMYTSKSPTRHLVETEQVAELVEFLCLSNASSQITGSAYLIDYGTTAA